jgi:Ca2+-binding RTX toxin-like protein
MLNSQYLATVRAQLALFAAQANFDLVFATAFGGGFDPLLLQELRQQWLVGDFSVIPNIEVLAGGELAGANGAYAAETDRIYLSADFLATAGAESVVAVLIEEIGHRIDRLLNGHLDSAGDEGEIFSALVRGIDLSAEELAALKVQNDHAVIVVNGASIAVEENTFNGGSGNDTYGGSPNNDDIYGYGGSDVLSGAGGNDTIYGGDGIDFLYGDAGDDFIDGGIDYAYNFISGGDGNDTLQGAFGDNTIYGDAGNDSIVGYSGSDTLYGGTGNDTIRGGDGINSIYGDAGNDTIYGGEVFEDGVGTGIAIGSIDAGSGDDIVYGDNRTDSIKGGIGNDTIYGGGGEDSIEGGAGNDTIYGGEGRDYLFGEDGDRCGE